MKNAIAVNPVDESITILVSDDMIVRLWHWNQGVKILKV